MTKYLIAGLLAGMLLGWVVPVHADALTAPAVAVCPSTPATPTCKYVFFPLSDTTHLVATGATLALAKSNPVYQLTLPNIPPTNQVLACLPPDSLSADLRRCLKAGSNGVESSVLVAKSTLVSNDVLPPPSPPLIDYSAVTGYTFEQSYDDGATWDGYTWHLSYPPQVAAHCFRISVTRADGNGPPVVVCPLLK